MSGTSPGEGKKGNMSHQGSPWNPGTHMKAKQMVPAPLHKSGELTPVEKGVHPLWLYKDRKGRSGKSGVSSES